MTDEAARAGPLKFLVTVDDSRDCRVALRFAALRARNNRGRVALLRVVEPPKKDGPSV